MDDPGIDNKIVMWSGIIGIVLYCITMTIGYAYTIKWI